MATIKNVIILMPNGRKQNIEVTPNSTILQVLDKICQNHGYNINEYDLKYLNQVLDHSAMLRFIGLRNNAQLEMIPSKKRKCTSRVTIGIQLENGQRLTGEFEPSTTLMDVLHNVNFLKELDKIALVYMHCEISGVEMLKNTTLKSLGLDNGKAILRVVSKNQQTSSETLRNNEDSYQTTDAKFSDNCSQNIKNSEVDSHKDEKKIHTGIEKVESLATTNLLNESDVPSYNKKYNTTDSNATNYVYDRNPLIYNLSTIQGTSRDELPDDFYDLTVNDAKILLRDIKHYRRQLEEAPLLTSAQRKLSQEKEILHQLDKYHCTIIRIYFPDQFVLQGLFQPMETIQAVKDFVKEHLTEENSDFILFTTPPKHVLDPKASLINEKLVPCANVHYSGTSTLKSNVKLKITDQKNVEMQVFKVRKSMVKGEHHKSNKNIQINESTSSEITYNAGIDSETLDKKDGETAKVV